MSVNALLNMKEDDTKRFFVSARYKKGMQMGICLFVLHQSFIRAAAALRGDFLGCACIVFDRLQKMAFLPANHSFKLFKCSFHDLSFERVEMYRMVVHDLSKSFGSSQHIVHNKKLFRKKITCFKFLS